MQHPTYKVLKTLSLYDYLLLESLSREMHDCLQVIDTWNSPDPFTMYGKAGEFASCKLVKV